MFDYKLFCTLAAIAVVVVTVITLSSLPQSSPHKNDDEIIASQAEAELDTPAPIIQSDAVSPEFVVKEHEGHIAVFYQNEEKPQIVLDTQVKFLPDYDRVQLKSGIAVYSYEELSALIEDYIS